jgi:hypothetical protein
MEVSKLSVKYVDFNEDTQVCVYFTTHIFMDLYLTIWK